MRVLREGPVKITKATIEAAWKRRAKDQRLMVGDAECRGLALVVNPTGMTWRFDYKPRGVDPATGKRFASQSVTIGTPESHTVDEARTAANGYKGQAKGGADPAAERKAKIAEAAKRRGERADRLLEEYVKAIPKRPKLRGAGRISAKHAAEETSHVKAAVAAMKAGGKPVSEIGAADIRLLLKADPETPNAARHRFGAVSRFFDWCKDEGLVPANPCALIAKARRPKAPASRDHYLTPAELARLWKVAGEAEGLDAVHRDLIRFLIAVPCRRGEATRMEWSHLDLAAGTWAQPGHMTKNGDPHRLHLHPLALALLTARHEAAGKPTKGLVFPSPRASKPVDSFTKIKAALVKAAPDLTGWRFHDTRRSFASALGEAGVSETVADAILNHRQAATRAGVLGVYQRASRWPEQVAAMNAWGDFLAAAIDGKAPPNNVVPLARKAG
jgi:integrase